jgi:hypothetical protein
MERTWMMRGAVGAAALVGAVLILLPPTQPKSSWTSVQRAAPMRIDNPAGPNGFEPSGYSAVEPVTKQGPAITEPVEPRRDVEREDEATAREIAIAESDRAYSSGYGWADENGVEDRRECRRLNGSGAEGCRDYVASLVPERNF